MICWCIAQTQCSPLTQPPTLIRNFFFQKNFGQISFMFGILRNYQKKF